MHTLISLLISILTVLPIVPYPQEVREHKGSFDASDARCIIEAGVPELSAEVIGEFASEYHLDAAKGDKIIFDLNSKLGDEAYTIDISKHSVKVCASSHKGFVNAVQTLRQLLTAGSKVPCVSINDWPRFSYRGMHLDCARKYYSVDFIKKYLDICAFHKINKFHWHLTDDHGWRLEIKKYPDLVKVGAFGNIGSRVEPDPNAPYDIQYEGYYTQDDVREIVRYAAKLGIDVIPEIDLPGHMTAAMAAYPWLGCTGGPYQVVNVVGPRGKGLARDSLCPGRESTFEFIENVLDEVMELFPYQYIHLGGDECIKDRWMECQECQARVASLGLEDRESSTKWQQLEVWMINRLADYLQEHGRKAIGWDEILDGDLGHNATVMSWRGTETGIKAAQRGYDVIMCPVNHAYFDYRQSRDIEHEPKAIAGTVNIDSVYNYNPTMGLDKDQAKHVIGAQGNLWCDVIGSEPLVEYMLLPRLAALSEVQWCSLSDKDFGRFKEAMNTVRRYYDNHGYTYARHLWGIIGLPGYDYVLPEDEPGSCTSIMVGCKASSDGSVMTAHACDSYFRTYVTMEPSRTWADGQTEPVYYYTLHKEEPWDTRRVAETGRITPPKKSTYRFINTAYPCMNEKQVAIGETTFDGRRELLNRNGIFWIEELERIALEYCDNARDAVLMMGEMAEKYGYVDWGECLTVADPHEVWQFEINGPGPGAPGAIWAAERIPDDEVGISANRARIGEIDFDDHDNFMYCKDLRKRAKELGLWDGKEPLKFYRIVANDDKPFSIREFYVFNKLAPSLGLSMDDDELPFSIKPEMPVTPEMMTAFYRETYEGTEYDMAKNLAVNMHRKIKDLDSKPYPEASYLEYDETIHPVNAWMSGEMKQMINGLAPGTVDGTRPIAVIYCSYSWIAQCRSWLPDGVGGVVWFSYDNPAQSPRFPIYCGGSSLPESMGHCGQNAYREDAAVWAFRETNRIATICWDKTRKFLEPASEDFERRMFSQDKEVQEQYKVLEAEGKHDEAVKVLDNQTSSFFEMVAGKWKDLKGRVLEVFIRSM